MAEHDARRACPQRLGSAGEVACLERERLGAHQPCRRRPAGQGHDDHDAIEREGLGLGERGRDADLCRIDRRQHDQQRQERQGDHAIGEAHQRAVEPAAEIARDDADDGAQQRRQHGACDADQQRDPAAIQQTLQQVAAKVVGAEPVAGRGPFEAMEKIGRGGIDAPRRGDERSGERQGQQQCDEDERCFRQTMPPEAAPQQNGWTGRGAHVRAAIDTRGSTATSARSASRLPTMVVKVANSSPTSARLKSLVVIAW